MKKKKKKEGPLNVTSNGICILERATSPLFLKRDRWCCDSNATPPRWLSKFDRAIFHPSRLGNYRRVISVLEFILSAEKEARRTISRRLNSLSLRTGKETVAWTAVSIAYSLIIRNHDRATDTHAVNKGANYPYTRCWPECDVHNCGR